MARFAVSALNLGSQERVNYGVVFDIKLDLSFLEPTPGENPALGHRKRAILLNVKPQLLSSLTQWYSDRDGKCEFELVDF